MKVSALAVAVASALGLDSAQTLKVKSAIDVAFAADKAKDKAKDEGGLGNVEIEKAKDAEKDEEAKDEFPPEEKAKDEDETDSDKTRGKDKAKDKAKDDMDDMDAEDEDETVQPKKSATGNSGAGGAEPTKDKKAMDAAIKLAIDARDALHAARREVEGVVGVVTYDSAAEVYGAALKKLGVDTAGVDPSAYRSMFQLAVDRETARTPVFASDSATVAGMAGAIKGYNRI
jgi:hypothetical protein